VRAALLLAVTGCYAPQLHPEDAAADATVDSLVDAVPDAIVSDADLGCVADLTLGAYHGCLRFTGGQVACWGDDAFGELGDGTADPDRPTPEVVAGVTAEEIAAGENWSCARTGAGLMCWGSDSNNKIGSCGATATPVLRAGLPLLSAVELGAHGGCGLSEAGDVWCWGDNDGGQLGLGVTSSSELPTLVTGLAGIVAIGAGSDHTCFLDAAGAVSCAGNNGDHQLGVSADSTTATCYDHDGTARPCSPSPVNGVTIGGAAELALGRRHTCVRTNAGAVHCWGDNNNGQLGDGSTVKRATPAQVELPDRAVSITASRASTCAALMDGTLWCWGVNDRGQLMDGTQVTRLAPTRAVEVSDVVKVRAHGEGSHTCALGVGGVVFCAGANGNAQSGQAPGGGDVVTPARLDFSCP
jgi:alpha-tubulin suppressor-like RCC1 family protein